MGGGVKLQLLRLLAGGKRDQAVFVPIGPCVHGSEWPAKANDVPKGALKYWFLVSSPNVFLLKNHFISKKTSNISF